MMIETSMHGSPQFTLHNVVYDVHMYVRRHI